MPNISLNNLADEITKAVREYTEDVSNAVVNKVDDVADLALQEMKNTVAPRRTGNYAKTFTKTNKSLKTHGSRKYVIWNKKHYRLVHLLEFGHAKANGKGRVAAQSHMVPVYNKYAAKLENDVKDIIRRGG